MPAHTPIPTGRLQLLWMFPVAIVISSLPLWANGGGYYRGGVESSGTVSAFEPSQTQAVRILDEQLTVDLGEKEAEVQVRYIMRNITDKRVKVRFGFPIEESFDHFMGETPAMARANALKIPQSAKGYRATFGGKPLKAKFVAENPDMGIADKRFKGIAGWMVSEAIFNPGQDIDLAIRFRQPFSEEGFGLDSGGGDWSAKHFRYRLSTGGAWAGSIARGRIELRPRGIDPSEVKILKPAKQFRREGENWIWEFADLEPTLADDLEVEVVPPGGDYDQFKKRGTRWTETLRDYRVTASSEQTDYPAANIRDADDDNATAWAARSGTSGEGEWLELRPEKPKPLVAILLKPGYQSSGLFIANARPKIVRVQLNGEHEFTAQVPDENTQHRIPVAGYAKPVKSVRLTFENVWKGKTSNDLCVTDVALEVALPGKPDIFIKGED